MADQASLSGAQLDSSSIDTRGQAHSTAASGSEDMNTQGPQTPYLSSNPASPIFLSTLSRSSSYIRSQDEFSDLPPPEKLTFFDLFENIALPERIEKWQATINAQREKIKKRQERLRSQGKDARDRAVAEFKRRVPTADEQLAKYRSRMKQSVDDLNKRWTATVTISAKEKISFISAVLNIFLSGYLIGAVPEYFYLWFTAQLVYFMPIRFVTYHRKGYHYFLADLCYFVNALCCISIWLFPRSKRLFIATWCLAYGNNAVAIVMWRNSLVFHSLDKVTSLFIHVMPPVTLHCIAHLTPSAILKERFPAVYDIKFSKPGSPEHYSLPSMLLWATLPYAIWQFSYHFFITVRRREKIAAGRPTSFTWLRKSYSKNWLGKFVISLPDSLQEPAFMLIQYTYALLTIIPCPVWFWYRWASASFVMLVFSWSVWNGANYYMDVFGVRFQKELEAMKRDVAKWQNSPGTAAAGTLSPIASPKDANTGLNGTIANDGNKSMGVMELMEKERQTKTRMSDKRDSVDNIPLLDADGTARSTGAKMLQDLDREGMSARK